MAENLSRMPPGTCFHKKMLKVRNTRLISTNFEIYFVQFSSPIASFLHKNVHLCVKKEIAFAFNIKIIRLS